MMRRWRRWGRALALCCAGVSLLGSGGTFSEQDARLQLGRRLFYDADLSADGSMSCATCHEQRHAFADGNATHPGVTEEPGIRNVPSLGNVGSFTTLTWIDQHISRLETQFFVPVMGHTPVEMGMPDRATLVGRIADDTCYRKLFARGFTREGGRITPQTIAQAVATTGLAQQQVGPAAAGRDKAEQSGTTRAETVFRAGCLFYLSCGSAVHGPEISCI